MTEKISQGMVENLKAKFIKAGDYPTWTYHEIEEIIDSMTEPEKELPDVIYIPDDCEDGDHGRWRSKKDIFISPGSCEWKAERTSPEDYHYYRARDCMSAIESKIESADEPEFRVGDFVIAEDGALLRIDDIDPFDECRVCDMRYNAKGECNKDVFERLATDADWIVEKGNGVKFWAEQDKNGTIVIWSKTATISQHFYSETAGKIICQALEIPIKRSE